MKIAACLESAVRYVMFGALLTLLTRTALAGERRPAQAERVAGRFTLVSDSEEGKEADEAGPEAGPSVGLKPRATLNGHPALVYCVRFTSDGKMLVSGDVQTASRGAAT